MPKIETNPYKMIPAGGNPRLTEAWALTEAAKAMRAAQAEDASEEQLLHAARLNWRLWTIFQADLSQDECPLPVEIRQNMLSLCNFIDKAMVDIIANPKPEKLNVLININREIAYGLFSSVPEENAQAETSAEAANPGPTNQTV